MKKGFTVQELLMVLALVGVFVLVFSPSFLGLKGQAQQVTAKEMESSLNRSYANWLDAGGNIQGVPMTSDVLNVLASPVYENMVVATMDDRGPGSGVIKDGGFSRGIRVTLPSEVALPTPNSQPSRQEVAGEDYKITFNGAAGGFKVTPKVASGGGSPGGSSSGGSGDNGGSTSGGISDGGGTTDNGNGETIDQPPPPPPSPIPSHSYIGNVSAYTWDAPSMALPHTVPSIMLRGGTDPVVAAGASKTREQGKAIFFANGNFIFDYNLPVYATSEGDASQDSLLFDPRDRITGLDSNGVIAKYWSPWLANGIFATKARMDQFFSDFQRAGGKLDEVHWDWEAMRSSENLSVDNIRAIYADPRAVSLNLPPLETVISGNGPSYSYRPMKEEFNRKLAAIQIAAYNEAICEVVWRYYPGARQSNYRSFVMTPANAAPNNFGDNQVSLAKIGNENAPVTHGAFNPYLVYVVPLIPSRTFDDVPFNHLLLNVNTVRGILRSGSDPVTPWINYAMGRSEMATETIYHYILSGCKNLLNFNPSNERISSDDQKISEILAQLNQRIGSTERRIPLIQTKVPWDSKIIISGVKIGNSRTLWRITNITGLDIKVVQTGQILNMNGQVGVWYESANTGSLTFETYRRNNPEGIPDYRFDTKSKLMEVSPDIIRDRERLDIISPSDDFIR